MSEHTREDPRTGRQITPPHDGSVEKLAGGANVGLVGVPLAYVTSQSVVITLIAVALAIAVMIAYVVLRQR